MYYNDACKESIVQFSLQAPSFNKLGAFSFLSLILYLYIRKLWPAFLQAVLLFENDLLIRISLLLINKIFLLYLLPV
jgi:hypothetical protein